MGCTEEEEEEQEVYNKGNFRGVGKQWNVIGWRGK